MATSSVQQNPLIAAHGESSVALRDREDAGLHDDQLVHGQDPIRVPTHEAGRVYTRLHDRRRGKS
jgi:hypothetical protein